MKTTILFFLIFSACEQGEAQTDDDACIVMQSSRPFFAEDLKLLRKESPSTITKEGSARLLFDVLRSEEIINGSVVKVRSMKERLGIYEQFLSEYPATKEAIKRLEETTSVTKGPCFKSNL